MKRVLFALIVCLALGWIGWRVTVKIGEKSAAAGTGGRGGPRGGGPARAVPVAVAPVRTLTVRDVRLFTGTLRPDSEFLVASKIGGRLKAVTVQLGEPVPRGRLIAQLDAEEHERRVEQAQAELLVAQASAESVRLDAMLEDEELAQKVSQVEAELGIARANVAERDSSLTVARREYERAKALREKTVMSESGLDEAEARFLAETARREVALAQVAEKEAVLRAAQVRLSETHQTARANELRLAQAQVAQKEAALKAVEVQVSYTQIHADWEGGGDVRYVGERYVDEGAMLTANTPLLSIVDINRLRAFIDVIERDYPLMRVGQEAVVTTDAYPGETFTGRILRISHVLQETSRQARVEVAISNTDLRLKPGMFARLEIEFARHADARVVPRAAVVQHHGSRGVFAIDEEAGVARFVGVQLGIVNGDWAEILEPVVAGSVVTIGHHLLSDGAPVLVSEFNVEAQE